MTMRMERKLIGYYNYTVILTYIGMLIGFVGIISAMNSNVHKAIICLMVSGLCDMFDGAIASTMERTPRERSFGIQIDSLSDLICFGVLPAVIVFKMTSPLGGIPLFFAALYVLCALIRLAYFNVDEQERQKYSSGPREVYLGLPVTLAALVLPLSYLILRIFNLNSNIILVPLMLMGSAFLIPFRLRKPRLIGKIAIVVCGAAEMLLFFYTSFMGLLA